MRVHNRSLLSDSLIGTARLPLDVLVVLHASVANATQQSPSSSNLDSHTFWVEIGRENRQAVPAGAVLLSVDSFTFNREEDKEALRAAMSVKVDRRVSLPSLLHRDDTSRENSEGERERKDRGHSLPSEPSFTAPPHLHPLPSSTPSAASSSPPTPQNADKKGSVNNTLTSPSRPPLQSYASTSQSSSFSQPPQGQGPSSSPHSRQSSLPAPNPKLRLFGGPLSNGIARSRSSVPVVVYVCIQYLIYHGLQTVGLFRISPSSVMVEAIKASFENGDSVNISDPHATAAVLKSYFRELTDPLIPYSAFSRFIAATADGEAGYGKLKEAVGSLEKDNRVVLSFLLHFLTLVAGQQAVNRMSPRNLAVVWAPNLLRGPNSAPDLAAPDAQQMAREMHKAEECIGMMIEGYTAIFPDGPPKPFQLDHPQKDRPQVATPRLGASRPGERFKEDRGGDRALSP